MCPDVSIPARRIGFTLLFSILMVCAVLNGNARAQDVQQAAAIVNDEIISTYDLDQRIKLVTASSGIQPTPEILQRIRNQVLRGLVDERLQMREVKKYDIKVTEEEVNDSLNDIAKRNNITAQGIKEMLERSGVDEETLRNQIRVESAWTKLTTSLLGSRVYIGDADIDEELKRLVANFNETQYLVSEIVLNVNDPSEEEDVRRTAQRLLEQMQKGTAFNAVAQQFSQSPSAAQGGELGWVMPEDLDPEAAKNLPKMLPGQVTSPIRTAVGYQILALRSKRKGSDGEPGKLISATLKQIFAPVPQNPSPGDVQAARAKMDAIAGKINGCSNVEAVAQNASLISADLGTVKFNDIAPFFRSTVATLEPGQASQPIDSPIGVHIIVLCSADKTEGVKAVMPTRDQVEDRLYAQQISVLTRRYMRDLRRDAVVEYR